MDYSKSGGSSGAKSAPRPKRMNTKGAPKAAGTQTGKESGKAALLNRMKAAAAAKSDKP